MDRRSERVNKEWTTPDGSSFTWDHVAIEVLMDIRRELRILNGLLACPNFMSIPMTLRNIARQSARSTKRTKS